MSDIPVDAYGKLLAVATTAEGDEKMDQRIAPLAGEDRQFLESAIHEFAINSDPIRKLKHLISQLQQQTPETDEEYATLEGIVDSLIDLGGWV
jgi:hypothetical protein